MRQWRQPCSTPSLATSHMQSPHATAHATTAPHMHSHSPSAATCTQHAASATCTLHIAATCWQGEHTAAHKCCQPTPAHPQARPHTPSALRRHIPAHASHHQHAAHRSNSLPAILLPGPHTAALKHCSIQPSTRTCTPSHSHNPSRNHASAHAPRLTPASTRRSAASSTQPCMQCNTDC